MSTTLLVIRLILAAVFAVAGVGKLADRDGSRHAASEFGVPLALVGTVAIVLPLAELATAALLLVPATARWGAIAALVLLAAFMVAIARSIARGEAPDCHCFGQLHSEPAGPATLARNAGLAALATFVIVAGWNDAGASPVGWLNGLPGTALALVIVGTLLGAVVMAQWAMLFALLRQHGRVLHRLDALEAGGPPQSEGDEGGLPVGTEAPAFELPGLDGVPVTLDALRAPGRPVLLVFTDPDCGPCTALLPDLGRWQHDHADVFTMAVVSRGSADANQAKAEEHNVARVLLQDDREVALEFDCPATPTAVLVDADGRIASRAAPGPDSIHRLVAEATRRPAAADRGARLGTPAPDLSLPLLEGGGELRLADAPAEGRLLLFWNTDCGFCSQMVDRLRAFEDERPPTAPEIVLVSNPDEAANRAQALRSTVVVDASFGAASAFGTGGTPTAVLVDAQGLIASRVAEGADAVLALAAGAPAS
jgi:methylamine dehydrogenase accessory protein MauD